MKFKSRQIIVGAIGTTILCLLGVAPLGSQARPEQQNPLLAEEVFKNVQLLRGVPVNQFMETMGFFSASLGMNCTDCHTADDKSWESYASDNTNKQAARRMILMMNTINRTYFGGHRLVTCYSCHRGGQLPQITPNLTEIYSTPSLEGQDEITEQAPGGPSADQILDKYIGALGEHQNLANLTSFVARGTSVGYGPEGEKRPVEVFGTASEQRTTIIHTLDGDSTTAYDGHAGWIAAPHRPVPVLALTGGDLDGAKLDADLSFPARIKQALGDWRVGFPSTIDDREVQVVQGTSTGGSLVTLYFDSESGLLVRQMRYSESPVGRIPTQIDYADYRMVAGVKMPFRWTLTWLDGRTTTELNSVQPNTLIDAAKFAKPTPPVPPGPATR